MQKQGLLASEANKGRTRLTCIKFDGRKDQTLNEGNQLVVEEHISVVAEQQGQYLDHFSPLSGRARHIELELYDILAEHDSLEIFLAIGSDGTSVNTGKNNGNT